LLIAVFGVALIAGTMIVASAVGDINCNGGYCEGNEGGNTIIGTASHDNIYAFGGDDYVQARGANDDVTAGEGQDKAFGELDDDFVEGNQGWDTRDCSGVACGVEGGAGADAVYGKEGNDMVAGSSGNDGIYGGTEDDTLVAADGSGGDSADGGAGFDMCYVDVGDDYVSCLPNPD
jgi:Ca2+-binding RTX toxin-like protein